MRLAWATDTHLDCADQAAVERFLRALAEAAPDAVLLSGDIAEANTIEAHLLALERRLARPIYFALGNHDFYHASIAVVRQRMQALDRRGTWLRWLPLHGVVQLTSTTALVGVDSWADGRLGNGSRSEVVLNDYLLIAELTGLSRAERFHRLNELGDQAACQAAVLLPEALAQHERVLLLTHVPPFREASFHEDGLSDDEFLPHFSCKALGDVLMREMRVWPRCELTVLCGHTHTAGCVSLAPNLHVQTGRGWYGDPGIAEILVVP